MKNNYRSLFCYFLALLAIFSFIGINATAEEKNIAKHAEEIINSIASNTQTENIISATGSTQGDWYAFALSMVSSTAEEYLKEYETKLPDADTNIITDLHRAIITVNALGGDARSFCGRDIVSESIFQKENLGKQGANGYIWALIALDSKAYQSPENALNTRESIIDSIIGLMAEDGSYSLNGKVPDADLTAMAVTSLSPYYNKDDKVKKAIDKSLNWLSRVQKESGGFASWGEENAESVAQVIIALCSLGIDIEQDERFIKNGRNVFDVLLNYYIENTGFSHTLGGEESKMSTAQGLCALISITRAEKGERIFDLTETSPHIIEQHDNSTGAEEQEHKTSNKLLYIYVIIGLIICLLAAIAIKFTNKLHIFIIIAALILAAVTGISSCFETTDEYYGKSEESINPHADTVFITIRCDEAIKSDDFNQKLIEDGYIPQDGKILSESEFQLNTGESVFDILKRATASKHIHMEYEGGAENAYIEGLCYLYEFDCGNTSGWMYTVNGERPNAGISQYFPKDGDEIEIYYTVDYSF